ncbi:hypothetical protein [Rhodoplanes sp. SY1]|uniref:hypothetical protein n=1 Tax=Rhodoplanes sp. SY1 TaxID=3166646 RepID=UPI0038B6297B
MSESAADLPPITLALMRTVVRNRALDIEDAEARDVRDGLKAAPVGIRMEEARVLHKLDDLLGRLQDSPAALSALGFNRAARAPGK